MKQVVEAYAGLWIIMILLMLAISFTSINMNTAQARKIVADIKAEVQASNGTIVPDTNMLEGQGGNITQDGYAYKYQIDRQSLVSEGLNDSSESYIYNSIYKIRLEYEYVVPLFGRQIYPLEVFAY